MSKANRRILVLVVVVTLCIVGENFAFATTSNYAFIDKFDRYVNNYDWDCGGDDTTEVSSWIDWINHVYVIDYTFNSGNWVYTRKIKNLKNDIIDSGISVDIKTEGAVNTLQFKWIDEDGSIFGATLTDVSFSDYQTVILKDSDFSYFWGGDNQLDDIVDFEITVVASEGGEGRISLQNLEYSTLVSDFSTSAKWSYGSHNNTPFIPTFNGTDNEVTLDYDFTDGDWCYIQRIDTLPYHDYALGLSFDLKTQGDANNLELKWMTNSGQLVASHTLQNISATQYIHYDISGEDFMQGVTPSPNDPIRLEVVVSKSSGGSGIIYLKNLKIKKSAIAVSTLQELQAIQNDPDESYYLTNDIDASDTVNWNNGEGFDSIGTYKDDFNGSFDGRFYTISNLTVNRTGSDIGLFARITDATVKNVTLANVSISGESIIGGLTGSASYNTKIQNCHISGGSITGTTRHVAGLVGSCAYNVDIENCHVDSVAITNGNDSFYTGGLAGVCEYDITVSDSSVSNCSITGAKEMGGICGTLYQGVTISRSKAINNSIQGTNFLGGFVGKDNYMALIENCYASGSVSGNYAVGGFIAINNYIGTPEFVNSYARVAVSGNQYVGGFGAMVGGNMLGFENCFWDYEIAGLSQTQDNGASPDIPGVLGITTADMQDQTTFSAWDFTAIWKMATYPEIPATNILEDFEGIGLWNATNTLGWWDIDGTLVYQHELVTDIVHSGNQAMKVDYDKNGYPWSLFAGYIAPENSNKDFSSFTKLSFWVYGDVQILVKLRDRTYNEQDVATVTGSAGSWTKVIVDFSSLTINLADVDNVVLFAEPGDGLSTGTFYIDDITLSE